MTNARTRRYPGLNYFTTKQKDQFFGRDDEKAALRALVLTEKIVALFGKSGYGKSSLLRAGLIPELPADWLPIIVQFGAFQKGQSPAPLARVVAQLEAALPDDAPEMAFLEKISPTASLWKNFKQKQTAEKRQFLLIFDQFEEFQTYPPEQREDFKRQLAELLFTRIPQAVRDRSDELPDAQQNLLARPNEVRAVFAIREDRLSVLDSLADKLPAILHKRFHLKGLDDAQATAAIEAPARLAQGTRFESPEFEYTPAAVAAIKKGLKKDENDPTIESFLLQICCEDIERKVIERAAADPAPQLVTEADLPVFKDLFEQYYRSKIAALPDENRRTAARRMIEDHLVKTDPASGIAYRIPADGRALCALAGVDEALLKQLTDFFLLRSEPNSTGGFSYEVSHDRLVDGILVMKTAHEAEEAERLAREAAAERERQLKEEEARIAREKLDADRRRKRALATAFFAGFLILGAVGATVFALKKMEQAEKASQKAVATLLDAAKKDIFHLRHAAAFQKMVDAAALGSMKDSVAQTLLEIAFFDFHSDQNENARTAFNLAAELMGSPARFQAATFEKDCERLDTAHFDFLKKRYFGDFVKIEGGTFWMGCDSTIEKCENEAELPRHPVKINTFSMARTEATMWQFGLYCAAKRDTIEKYHWSSWGDVRGSDPVIGVSWHDANDYAEWLSKKTGRSCRLPSEAEWEYAARGGNRPERTIYAGSNSLDSVAWFYENSNRTMPVGLKKANRLGLFDMSGNVWEWCADSWYDNYSNAPDDGSVWLDGGSNSRRCLRGGSWNYITGDLPRRLSRLY